MPRHRGPTLQAPHTVAVVLAAGAGSRMGGVPKCLIRLDGRTLLHRTLEQLQHLEVDEVRLVLGHHAAAVAAHINELPPALWPVGVHNPEPGDDPASSLRAGLQSLARLPDRALVLLGDQPLVDAADMQAALDAFARREPGQHALVPVVRGQPGHPVVLDTQACALLRERPTGGLRAWRAEQAQAVALWSTTNPHYVRDLDVPDDLAQLSRDTGLAVQAPPGTAAQPAAPRTRVS